MSKDLSGGGNIFPRQIWYTHCPSTLVPGEAFVVAKGDHVLAWSMIAGSILYLPPFMLGKIVAIEKRPKLPEVW